MTAATSDGGEASASRRAHEHATSILASCGLPIPVSATSDHPALAWRRAGLMAVTGPADGRALVAPVALTVAADGVLAALRALAPEASLPSSGALLLGERARLAGLSRRGTISPNGSCRLIETRDGIIALNLPREDDWSLLPALFEADAQGWSQVAQLAASAETEALVARGRLLGLAIAAEREMAAPDAPFRMIQLGGSHPLFRRPLVVDLGSLWAGPLAGSLLQACGADVVKVESTTRPDGARAGNSTFYALLNGGKQSVSLDFSVAADVAALRALVRRADIVIEASRPRALLALGIDARREAARGATWIAITAHGRDGAAADWIGFGDDAAVAGGLTSAMRRGWGASLFAGDAIADPLTGITAALAGWASWMLGGGRIVSLSLAQVVAHACGLWPAKSDLADWQALAEADDQPLYPLRSPIGPAPTSGADNARVLHGRDDVPPLP